MHQKSKKETVTQTNSDNTNIADDNYCDKEQEANGRGRDSEMDRGEHLNEDDEEVNISRKCQRLNNSNDKLRFKLACSLASL